MVFRKILRTHERNHPLQNDLQNEDNQHILQMNSENNIFMRNHLVTSKSIILYKPFYVNVPCSSPLKTLKNSGFLMFSGETSTTAVDPRHLKVEVAG